MHCNGLADDEAIRHKLADCLAGVCIGDLVDFVGVEPDFALAAAYNRGGETFLGAKVHPDGHERISLWVCDGGISDCGATAAAAECVVTPQSRTLSIAFDFV